MSASSTRRTSFNRYFDFVILIAVILAAWQALYLMVGDMALTAPAATLSYCLTLLTQPEFQTHMLASFDAFYQALLIAYALGLALGLTLGFYRFASEVMEPMLSALYSLPKLTLYPIVLLIFGLGTSAKVAFGVIHGLIPVTLFCMNAVQTINPSYLRTARSFRLSGFDTIRTIVTPAIIPEIFTGLRVGFSLTLLGVLTGEMFASQRGLGFLLINAINMNNVKLIMALIFLLFFFATCVNGIMLAVDKKLHQRS